MFKILYTLVTISLVTFTNLSQVKINMDGLHFIGH